MDKAVFEKRKNNLIDIINVIIADKPLSSIEKNTLTHLLDLVNQYVFENRLDKKGLITRGVIDSFYLDYSLGEQFIEFDNSIS